jgi:predicted nuclease of predicted toxin-antitoxin system
MAENANLFIAFYTDEHISKRLAADLRKKDYEAASSIDLGHIHWSDHAHLVYAAEQGMAVLTFDQKFKTTAEEWAEAGREFWGVVISPEFSEKQYGRLLKLTLNLLEKRTADELRNAVVYLTQFE